MKNVMELAKVANEFLNREDFTTEFFPLIESNNEVIKLVVDDDEVSIYVGSPTAMRRMVAETPRCAVMGNDFSGLTADCLSVVAWTLFHRIKPALPDEELADYDFQAVILSGAVVGSTISSH